MLEKSYIVMLLCVLLSTVFFFAGCTEYSVESLWGNREIIIDGSDKDWRNATFHNEHTNCALGVMNDNEYLYVSLTPWGRVTQGQIITSGLTIWFDKTGEEKKNLGITFPLPGIHEGLKQMSTDRKEAGLFLKDFAESQKDILLIESPDREPVKLSLDKANKIGIDVAVGDSDGRFSYELKVPLTSIREDDFSIAVDPGDEILVGFETGEMLFSAENEDSNYRRYIRNGERSSGLISERHNNTNRQYQPIGDRKRTEPFLYWVKISLAELDQEQ